MKVDLHTHTTASDGVLSPQELVDAAAASEIALLAITDHDTRAAYDQIGPLPRNLQLISGIELSSQWQRTGVHIVGLNFHLDSPAIADAVAAQDRARQQRAEKIALRLERLGLENALAGACAQAEGATLGRPHFARHMVDRGFVTSEAQAFRKYLGTGKSCDINTEWPDLATAIAWIRAAGGTAVLAHPGKYRLTRSRLGRLVADFRAAGGEALEVVSGQQLPTATREFAALAQAHGLMFSCGSDFHHPGQSWAQLGRYATLPSGLTPVWHRW